MGTQTQTDADASAVTHGRRASQRARLHLNASLVTTAQDFPVVLRNLSATGAMVQIDGPLPAGRTVALKRQGLDELAVVIWSRNGFCGLEFLDPISIETVLEQAAGPIELPPARLPGYQLAGGNEVRLSPTDWQTVKESVRRRLGRNA